MTYSNLNLLTFYFYVDKYFVYLVVDRILYSDISVCHVNHTVYQRSFSTRVRTWQRNSLLSYTEVKKTLYILFYLYCVEVVCHYCVYTEETFPEAFFQQLLTNYGHRSRFNCDTCG